MKIVPDSPYSKHARRLLVLGLLLPCILITIPAVIGVRADRQRAESVALVSHTIEVQRQLQALFISILSAETGQRGYLLTGRGSYLDPYRTALARLPGQLRSLRTLTSGNKAEQTDLRELERLVTARLSLMSGPIMLEERGEHEAALERVNGGQGRQVMNDIRERLELMGQQEARILKGRQELLAERSRFSERVVLGLVGLNFVFAAAMLMLARRLFEVQRLVTVCAWSRTVEYKGEWLSFEQYLQRRFGLDTSHGISPEEAEKAFGPPEPKTESAVHTN